MNHGDCAKDRKIVNTTAAKDSFVARGFAAVGELRIGCPERSATRARLFFQITVEGVELAI